MLGDEYITATGVILSREEMGEDTLLVKLFLREYGLVSVTAPSGKRGFGGDSEPFVWGIFALKHKSKSKNYCIYDIEAKDDMLSLRWGKAPIVTALNWSRTLLKYMIFGHPDDELLANLYWCMKLLCARNVPVEATDWKFMWRWLQLWGLAPDVINFHQAMNFTHDEIILLTQISELGYDGIVKRFSVPLGLRIRENMFQVASRLAMSFLQEK